MADFLVAVAFAVAELAFQQLCFGLAIALCLEIALPTEPKLAEVRTRCVRS